MFFPNLRLQISHSISHITAELILQWLALFPSCGYRTQPQQVFKALVSASTKDDWLPQNNHHKSFKTYCITYNWINQLSNTTIWWLDICCLLHRHQLHVSALTAIFWLTDRQQTYKQLYFGVHLVYGGGGLGLDGGTRSRVCWAGRVMWVHGHYCAGLRPAQ